MSYAISFKQKFINWAMVFGCFLIIAFFFSTESVFFPLSNLTPPKYLVMLRNNVFRWIPWALFTPLIIIIARRFPIHKGHRSRSLLVHFSAGIGLSLCQLFLYLLYSQYNYMCITMDLPHFYNYLRQYIHINLLTYGVIVGFVYLFDYYRKYQSRELRATKLETQLTQAQLEILKSQLHPHFLFNALHSISTLVYKKPDEADRMISSLSELLRANLENSGQQMASLGIELKILKNYLDLEKIRYQDRLDIELDIDPEVLQAQVPNLILQPLVENAIKHGIAPRKKGGKVVIRAKKAGDNLLLEIEDNGIGFVLDTGEGKRKGVGLTNSRERLQQLFGDEQSFEVDSRVSEGTVIRMTIPYRETDASSCGREEEPDS